MLLHRFIGLSELETLVAGKAVRPRGARNCLYFFPNEGEYHGSPEWELEYCSGIVGDMATDKHSRLWCLIDVSLPQKRLVHEVKPYADPEGSFFAKIYVDEFHLYGEYAKDDIQRVVLYDKEIVYHKACEFHDAEEAYTFLKGQNVRDYKWEDVFKGFFHEQGKVVA